MVLLMNSQGVFESDEFSGKCTKIVDFLDKNDKTPIDKRINNSALGAEVPITNLTYIRQRIVSQRFYERKPSDYLPVTVGEGAFMTHTMNYRTYTIGDGGFEEACMGTGADNPRQPSADFAIDYLPVKHKQYEKSYQYSLFELKQLSMIQASQSPITLKEQARKKLWDLGIQKTAFLGFATDPDVVGLLTIPTVTRDTESLTQSLASMSTGDFCSAVASLIPTYYANTNETAYPDYFLLPETDAAALSVAVSPQAPFNTRLQYMDAMFKEATGNPDFKIKRLMYCSQQKNGLGHNRYVLGRYDEDVARMSIPIDYTTTVTDTVNGFNWYNSAYGQFTGVICNLPQYLYYLDFANPSS